jgi:hypothetical protein
MRFMQPTFLEALALEVISTTDLPKAADLGAVLGFEVILNGIALLRENAI